MEVAVRSGSLHPRRVLSYGEEKFLDQKIKYLEEQSVKKEVQQGVNYDPRDMRLVARSLAEAKAMKSKFGAVRLEGKERIKAEIELKKVEELIAKKWGGKVPSYSEYWMTQKQGGIHYLNLVDKIYNLNKDHEYHALIQRWKYLRRGLEPYDKNIDSTLHLHQH